MTPTDHVDLPDDRALPLGTGAVGRREQLLLVAIETLPALLDSRDRQNLLDLSAQAAVFLSRRFEGDGLLERAAAFRRIARAFTSLHPLEVDTRVAGVLAGAVAVSRRPGADRMVDRMLRSVGV